VIQHNRTTRFFAAMLIGGGAIGMAIVAIIGFQLVQQSWLLIVPMAGLAAVFAWAAFTGVRLWQGTPYGRKWAPILFASQIPVLAIPGLKYQWFTGANFGPAIQFGSGSTEAGFSANIGANGDFLFGPGVTECVFGINLFAIIALVLLVRSNNAFKPTPPRGTA
jgi:hypothetical protein